MRIRLSYARTIFISLTSNRQEKWNSSGANEAVGKFSQNIPDSTKQYIGSVFKRDHIRSITVYFGIGEDRPFYFEKTPSLLLERLRHNVTFFYLNYLLLTGVLFCLTLLISPSAIIGMGLLALAWMWVIRASQSGSLSISGKQPGAHEKQMFPYPSCDHPPRAQIRLILSYIGFPLLRTKRVCRYSNSPENGFHCHGGDFYLCLALVVVGYFLVDLGQ